MPVHALHAAHKNESRNAFLESIRPLILQWKSRKGMTERVGISIPVVPASQGSWPSPSQTSLTRGWGDGWARRVAPQPWPGVDPRRNHYLLQWVQSGPRRLAAKLSKAAWISKAVHRLMRADATECWKGARCLSGFCVREELDKTSCFFFASKDHGSAGNQLTLEITADKKITRKEQLDRGGCCIWSFDVVEESFCTFHVARV